MTEQPIPFPPGMTPGKACVAVACALATGLLLNGSALQKDAESMKYGTAHDFWCAVAKPAGAVSRLTRLDALRNGLAATAGAVLNGTVAPAGGEPEPKGGGQ